MAVEEQPAVLTGEHYLKGDIAAAEGAIAAGCRFFAGYPITPASEVAERMSERLPAVGGDYIQMEDELASMAAIVGGSNAGVKSMTATSGPGVSLMNENIGLASITETPTVIVNVQRGGPSTGMPTLPAQGDVIQAKWGSHGDYPIIAYATEATEDRYGYCCGNCGSIHTAMGSMGRITCDECHNERKPSRWDSGYL